MKPGNFHLIPLLASFICFIIIPSLRPFSIGDDSGLSLLLLAPTCLKIIAVLFPPRQTRISLLPGSLNYVPLPPPPLLRRWMGIWEKEKRFKWRGDQHFIWLTFIFSPPLLPLLVTPYLFSFNEQWMSWKMWDWHANPIQSNSIFSPSLPFNFFSMPARQRSEEGWRWDEPLLLGVGYESI